MNMFGNEMYDMIRMYGNTEFFDVQSLSNVMNDDEAYARVSPRVICEECMRLCRMNDLRWNL